MLRTLNFTGRKRIRREDVDIRLRNQGNTALAFDANLRLESYDLPPEACVFIEAQRQTTWMRYDCGTVSAPQAPQDTTLRQFETPDGIHFRVKVTSAQSGGMLLAEADNIPLLTPEQDREDRLPLLPLVPKDLGHEVWQVDFSGERPVLAVNKAVEDWHALAADPFFVALVLPHVLRQVLTRILVIDKYNDMEDQEDPQTRWLIFGAAVLGAGPPPEPDNNTAVQDWIDEATACFSRRNRLMDRFNISWSAEG